MSEISEAIAARIALLRRAAEGRAEYAKFQDGPAQAVLLAQAAALQSAADIMEGDDGPLYGLLPSWRWTDEMEHALFVRLAASEGATDACDEPGCRACGPFPFQTEKDPT